MFVRATTVPADPAKLDDGIAYVRATVRPAVEAMAGNLGLSMFCDRDTGLSTVSTAWESADAREASEPGLAPLRAEAGRILGGGPPTPELFVLAVLDRLRPAQEGFWTRMTRVSIATAQVDEAIDAYASSTLHDLQLLRGYCSAVLLVDRERGAGVVSVTFDSREALDASRAQAEDIRRTAIGKTGADIDEIREAQIVIAGLRLPQSG